MFHLDLVLSPDAPHDLPYLAFPLRRELLFSRTDTIWYPHQDLWNLQVWLLDGTLNI